MILYKKFSVKSITKGVGHWKSPAKDILGSQSSLKCDILSATGAKICTISQFSLSRGPIIPHHVESARKREGCGLTFDSFSNGMEGMVSVSLHLMTGLSEYFPKTMKQLLANFAW